MATTLNFREELDLPEWRVLSQCIAGSTITAANPSTATWFAEDLRNNDFAHPIIYYNTSASLFFGYNKRNDAWLQITGSYGASGTFANGAVSVFSPTLGPSGTLLASSTTTKLNLDTICKAPASSTWTRSGTTVTVTTTRAHGLQVGQVLYISATSDATATGAVSTTIPGTYTITAVGSSTTFTYTGLNAGATSGTITIGLPVVANQLANRGDGKGYIIRVIGNAGSSSGKIEERRIIANTAGPTPTVILDAPLSTTPTTGDTFELLSGEAN